jgi:hypothetical protein
MDSKNAISVAENFSEAGIELSETIVDSLLDDGVLKELPFIGILVSLYKAGRQVKDILYLNKLKSFVYGYGQQSEKMNKSILSDLENETKRKDLGIKILLIIESADSTEKAELIGKVFKLLINREIDSPTFLRLCHMINRSYYDYLLFLTKFTDTDMVLPSHNTIIESTILEDLFICGWLSEFGFDGGDASGNNAGTRYGLNFYGKIIIQVLPKGVANNEL